MKNEHEEEENKRVEEEKRKWGEGWKKLEWAREKCERSEVYKFIYIGRTWRNGRENLNLNSAKTNIHYGATSAY